MPRKAKSRPPQIVAAELLRQLALDCVLGSAEDPDTATKVRAGLTSLVDVLEDAALKRQAADALESLGAEGSPEEVAGLTRVGELLDQLETELTRTPGGRTHGADVEAAPPMKRNVEPAHRAVSLHPVAELPRVSSLSQPPAARDQEMVELFADFVAESLEGLDRAEAILLAAEQAATDSEQVNALFRVFHSIKGVSGFLSVAEVTWLAHVTEALLDQVRLEKLELTGEALDAVFDASASMRRTLEALRVTVAQGLPDPSNPTLPALIARLERASAQQAVSPAKDDVNLDSERSAAAGRQAKPKTEAPPDSVSSNTAKNSRSAGAANSDTQTATPAIHVETSATRIRDTVKVDLERVDSIVELVGELIIVESMVVNAPELADVSTAKLRNYLSQMTKISRDLQNATMRMRMVPVSGVFRKMARLVRDLSRKTGKMVQMVQSGETTEMDRSMVERIEDPLVHMIRNAIDHAVETPDERRALNKSATATLHLSASHEGGSVAIELTDDGRGLPRDRILKKARERGLIHDSGDLLSDQDVFALIFVPGFSTASQVTEISGRGVGMDVVKRSVEDMRGRVLVDSTFGKFTSFKLILPLTLAIIDGMLVSAGDERYIIPSLSIVESLQPTREMVHALGDGTELLRVRGEILPLLRLGTLFNIQATPLPAEQVRCVILESAGRKLGLLVDEILTQQQVVIKPLGEGLGNLELLAGAAILPDGRVGLILNVDRLGGHSGRRRRANSDSGEVAA